MIIGDFNIDIMCSDKISHEFLNNFSEKEYVPCILAITRPANDGCNGTCIDNIFLKSNSITPKAYKLCTNEISDHYPLIVALDNVTVKQINNRLNNFINYKKLLNEANLTEWNTILSINDPNRAVNMLISKIKNCLNNASSCKTNKKRDITCNLASVSAINKNGLKVTFVDNKCLVVNPGGAVILEGVLSTNSVYKVHFQPCPAEVNKLSASVAFKATVPQCIGLWHRRLACLNVAYLRQLSDVATGIQLSDGQLQKYEVCVAGKLTNKPFLKNKKHASSLLDLVHSDVCRVSEPSLGQAKYFVTFLNDFSRKIFVYLIKTKDEVLPDTVKKFILFA